ncbi:hypothetical protein GF369_04820 [Candidatus Peregrinibacteria bacterium]|nr:hypothetical protein [Candidatus Peregrinibacteria bacterium]
MPVGTHVHHHIIHRKKKKKNKHKRGMRKHVKKNILDRMIYFAGIAGPVMTLPQVFKIWMEKSAEGVALETWVTYLCLSTIWISYGLLHKEKPLVIMYSSYFFIHISIIIGVFLYT